MAYTYASVDDWLKENGNRMIECPLQPGQLKISRDACTKRYWVAQEEDLEGGIKRRDNLFAITLSKGLSLCRDCPIGRHLGFSKQAGSFEKRADAGKGTHRAFMRSEEMVNVRG